VSAIRVRRARPQETAFVAEMARLACGLDDRPAAPPDAPAVRALLPDELGSAFVAADDDDRPLGAAWLHFHDPPLLRDASGASLPELVMAVAEEERGRGIGAALVETVAGEAAGRFSALTLNVHLRNRAAHLYARTGFTVAGAGRGPLGVAMSRPLR
jgi:GNAT superfamily N-acetyltransferase